MDLTDRELQEVCDETGLARVDVLRVLKAVAAAEQRMLSDVSAHVEARGAEARNAPFTAERIGLMLEHNPFMRSLTKP